VVGRQYRIIMLVSRFEVTELENLKLSKSKKELGG